MYMEYLLTYIRELEIENDCLKEQLRIEKEKLSNKINKDYEDNRNMISDIFNKFGEMFNETKESE